MYKTVISIIVPCYNSEKYIGRCLDSIINQTFNEIEIIVINDGSTDSTIDVIVEYANKDNRIIVIDKINEGVSIARNIGIENASGNYTMFVDSDDWIDLNTCEIAFNEIEMHSADVVMWSYIREFPNASLKKNIFKEKVIVFEEDDIKNKLYRRQIGLLKEELAYPECEYALNPVVTKIYRLDLIRKNDIKFADLSIIGTGEDGYFNLEVFRYSKKIIYIDEYFYHYFKTNNDSCTSNYKPDLYVKWQKLFDMILCNLKSNFQSTNSLDAFNNRICLSIIWLGLNVCTSNKNSIEKIKEIKKILSSDKYRRAYKQLSFKYFPIHWKVFFLCARLNFATGVYVILLFIKKMIGKK